VRHSLASKSTWKSRMIWEEGSLMKEDSSEKRLVSSQSIGSFISSHVWFFFTSFSVSSPVFISSHSVNVTSYFRLITLNLVYEQKNFSLAYKIQVCFIRCFTESEQNSYHLNCSCKTQLKLTSK
jgi:hypothetical protein